MRITSEHLRALLDGHAAFALLDVREQRASDASHILGCTNVPRRHLEWRVGALVPRTDTTVCVYDDDLEIAPRAADDLRAVGYGNARVLEGGLPAWRAAGFEVTRGHSVPSKHFGELVQHHDEVPTVSPDELRAWLDQGRKVVLCDVRTAEEHARETLPGSVNVPGFELPHRLAELASDPDTTVVVHCSGRTRSIIGAATLRRSGVDRVAALENGTMGWLLAGHDVEHGASRDGTRRPAAADPALLRRWRDEARSVGVAFLPAERARRVLDLARLGTTYLFDVRTRQEFLAGHAAGARWAPSGQLVQLTDTFVAVRGARVVLMCDGSVRSSVAGYWLRRMGLGPVLVVDGGLPAWDAAGLPTEEGERTDVLGLDVARATVPAASGAALDSALASPAPVTVAHVDTSEHYAGGHVPGARWVSPTRLEHRLEHVGATRDRSVVFACRDGRLSTLAAWKARRAGWSDVAALEGGMTAWAAEGRPVGVGRPDDVVDPDDVFVHPIYRSREAMRAYLDWEVALVEPDGADQRAGAP